MIELREDVRKFIEQNGWRPDGFKWYPPDNQFSLTYKGVETRFSFDSKTYQTLCDMWNGKIELKWD